MKPAFLREISASGDEKTEIPGHICPSKASPLIIPLKRQTRHCPLTRQGSGAAAGTVPVPVRGPGAMRPGRRRQSVREAKQLHQQNRRFCRAAYTVCSANAQKDGAPEGGVRLPFPKPWRASGTSVLVLRQKKTRLNVCETSRRVKKFPAPCYSPIVKFTVPSPLEPLTAVFGKGTCVSAPL